jgi:hypothetical protein
VAAADACPDVSVNQGAERRRVPRRRVGGHGAGLGMAQKHDEDGRQGPDKADGTRDQPYDQFEVHHGPLFPSYPHDEQKRALAHRQPHAVGCQKVTTPLRSGWVSRIVGVVLSPLGASWRSG